MRFLKKSFMIFIYFISFFIVSTAYAQSFPDLLRKNEVNYEQFKEIIIADKSVYFYQRIIDDAIVEKDFKVYQFDKKTEKLLVKKSHWREDLPEHLLKIRVTKEQAESMIKGKIQFSKLYIISPESDVFPVKPTPKNPCWVVRSTDKGNVIVAIIDAMEEKILGYGISPPYTAFSLTGPWYCDPCWGAWTSWHKNAESWFNKMGYSTEAAEWPTEEKVKSHVQSVGTAMFYELAHGGDTGFVSGCPDGNNFEYTSTSEVETWIADYQKMPFTFLGSCGGMCSTGDDTLSYEFRKGSMDKTVSVGYCGMSEEKCANCWSYSLKWQDNLFNYMSQGWTVKAAFDQALADYPTCAEPNNCMRFVGDENFTVVPVVKRVCREAEGASPECEGKAPNTKWCGGNTKKFCNSTCQYSYEDCRTDAYDTDGGKNYLVKGTCYDYDGCDAATGNCKVTPFIDKCYDNQVIEYYVSDSFCATSNYNCKNSGLFSTCSDGKCARGGGCPFLKIWDGEKFVEVEKLNIHSLKGVDKIVETSFIMQPIEKGKYKIILKEAPYLSLGDSGSNIDFVRLTNENGKECKLISATHSKDGDILQLLKESDDLRVRTKPNEEIVLIYEDCSGSNFTFSIEGYNPLWWKPTPITIIEFFQSFIERIRQTFRIR